MSPDQVASNRLSPNVVICWLARHDVAMRWVLAVVMCCLVMLLAAGWTTDRSVPLPDACSAKNIKHHMKLEVGVFTRHCGPAAALVRVNGKSFTIRGGYCRTSTLSFPVRLGIHAGSTSG